MKKNLLFVLLFILIFNNSIFSQTKRVLIEQHTGAWCGWCVDGTVRMDEIIALYPDKVIGIKVHNGDSMVISQQNDIASKLGLTGYPTGNIDRRSYGGKIFNDRTLWKQYAETALNTPAKADVTVTYALNKTTMELVVKVSASMISSVYEQLKFNVYIIEDSLSGKGTGWDQSNYYNNLKGQETHPYYSLPSKIVGYQHMKVARAMLGGAWGEQGSFTIPATAGQVYEHQFSYIIPPEWKLKDLHIIGLVQVDGTTNKEVLNCAYGIEGEASLQLTSAGPISGIRAPQSAMDKTFELKNIAGTAKTYVIDITKSKRTPDDWTVAVEGASTNEFTLEPGEIKSLKLKLTPSDVPAIGDASMIISVKNDPGAFKGQGTITCVSSNIEKIEVNTAGESKYSLLTIMKNKGYTNYITFSPDEFIEFGNQLQLKVLIWNTGVQTGIINSEVVQLVEAINKKVPVFICGNQVLSGLSSSNSLGYFGVEYYGYSTQGYGSAPWRVWLSGIENDPISSDFGVKTEGNLIQYLISLINIKDTYTTKPILHFADAGKRVFVNGTKRDTLDISGNDAVFGVRYQGENHRMVLLSFTPFVIVSTVKKETLVDNIIKWITYVITDVPEENQNKNFTVYPNPANDYINIPDGLSNIMITNTLGESLSITEMILGKFSVGGLSSGIYILSGIKDGKVVNYNFSIIR